MTQLPLIITLVVVLAVLATIAIYINITTSTDEDGKKKKPKKKKKNKNVLIKEAQRKLAQNPKDPRALKTLADIYYEDNIWAKAYTMYSLLSELCATNPELDEFEISSRQGICAFKLNKTEEAYRALAVAYKLRQNSFEVLFHLGALEQKRGNAEHAIKLLLKANEMVPSHIETKRYLAIALYNIHKYKEALTIARQIIDQFPDDKEFLFAYADSMLMTGKKDQAIAILSHLKIDPVWGPKAAYKAGTTHLSQHKYDRAIADMEIGLRHEVIDTTLRLEMSYKLAQAYIAKKEVKKAVEHLRNIQRINPRYKDVEKLINYYSELNQNQNLKTYLISSPPDFLTLCRKIIAAYFPGAFVKVNNMSMVTSEYADLVCEVDARKWQDTILFRFMRTTGVVGELSIRDFHARLKDTRADRGICISAGDFSQEAKKFVEARLIDLLPKSELLKILKKVDSRTGL
ncbi:tetratricopeptide repeat protein [Spirochaetia bacterium 38H-sp]|uniref:Tetratricopeptide repeat protein n=1 Tax=Rarispira pelagica TaxID=3141764 RepID=A0ABU9UA20_9SPIR